MQYVFKTVKVLMQLPSKPPDLVSLRRFKLILGDDLKRIVEIRDLHADYGNLLVYENIHLLPGKDKLQKHSGYKKQEYIWIVWLIKKEKK